VSARAANAPSSGQQVIQQCQQQVFSCDCTYSKCFAFCDVDNLHLFGTCDQIVVVASRIACLINAATIIVEERLCDLAARGFVWTGLSAWIAKDALRPAMGKSNATVLAERLRRRGASRKEAGEASQLAAIAPVSKHANVHNESRTM